MTEEYANHAKAVLAAHERYSSALAVVDDLTARLAVAQAEIEAAQGELRALARRRVK